MFFKGRYQLIPVDNAVDPLVANYGLRNDDIDMSMKLGLIEKEASNKCFYIFDTATADIRIVTYEQLFSLSNSEKVWEKHLRNLKKNGYFKPFDIQKVSS